MGNPAQFYQQQYVVPALRRPGRFGRSCHGLDGMDVLIPLPFVDEYHVQRSALRIRGQNDVQRQELT
jgi:hypothetical protein